VRGATTSLQLYDSTSYSEMFTSDATGTVRLEQGAKLSVGNSMTVAKADALTYDDASSVLVEVVQTGSFSGVSLTFQDTVQLPQTLIESGTLFLQGSASTISDLSMGPSSNTCDLLVNSPAVVTIPVLSMVSSSCEVRGTGEVVVADLVWKAGRQVRWQRDHSRDGHCVAFTSV